MYQPTISHFFKSQTSSQEADYQDDSTGRNSTAVIKSDKSVGSNGQMIDKKELINLLDSQSDSDDVSEICGSTICGEKAVENSTPERKTTEAGCEIHKPFLGVSLGMPVPTHRPNDFGDRLSRIMKKRDAGSMLGSLIADEEEDDNEDFAANASRKKVKEESKLTELDQQFKELKLRHMDTILCVRVGYKYKFFAEDAEIVSNILQIKLVPGKKTLDGRNPSDKNYRKFQYCSIPDSRLNVHLQRLVFCNYKVGVVEQTETSAVKMNTSKNNSLFTREVKNIYTKVSYGINEAFDKDNDSVLGNLNSLWAISFTETAKIRRIALVSVNLNSGEVIYDQFKDDLLLNVNLEARIRHLNPTEVISEEELPESLKSFFAVRSPDIQFYQSQSGSCEELASILNTLNLSSDIMQMVSVLNSYLSTFENNKVLFFPSNYSSFDSQQYMILPSNTLQTLEIFENSTTNKTIGSLLWVLDHTRTPFGYRLLRKWMAKPLIDANIINQRLDAVSCIMKEVHNIFFGALNDILKKSVDLERALNRIAYGTTTRKEVYFFLKQIATFSTLFKSHHTFINEQILSENSPLSQQSSLMRKILTEANEFFTSTKLPELVTMINVDAALDKNVVKNVTQFFDLTKYDSPESLLQKYKDIEDVRSELEEELVNIRRILNRPTMNFKDTKEYLLEVRNTQLKTIPNDWIKVNSTKSVSRYRSPKTAALVSKLQYHNELLGMLAEEEFKRFLERIVRCYPEVKKCIHLLSTYDCLLSLAASSSNVNYVRPDITETPQTIKIRKGRNPIIESLDVNYVPNDISMSPHKSKINIITGPNMGGKSSYIRQVALLVIMSQIGCYIPAEHAEISICDRIFTRIGSHDNLMNAESTFFVEMSEVLHIIETSTPRSLLLLDEVGRGTGTHDGLSISHALLEYFIGMRENCPLVLFITHYLSLCQIDSPLVANYHMSFIERRNPGEEWTSVIFLYRLICGQAHSSFGFNVAKISNIPTDIINRAFEVSEENSLSNQYQYLLHIVSALKSIKRKRLREHELKKIILLLKDT